MGPYPIISIVEPAAYWVQLPASLAGVHTVFHMSIPQKCVAIQRRDGCSFGARDISWYDLYCSTVHHSGLGAEADTTFDDWVGDSPMDVGLSWRHMGDGIEDASWIPWAIHLRVHVALNFTFLHANVVVVSLPFPAFTLESPYGIRFRSLY